MKRLVILCIAMCLCGIIHAQQKVLTVHLANGTEEQFTLSETSGLYFMEQELEYHEAPVQGIHRSFPYSDVRKITFSAASNNGIGNQATKGALSVYPNPAQEKITLVGEIPSQTPVKVYSITGVKMFEGKLSEGESLNIATWGKGLYFLQAGEQTIRFIKH